jgi:transcriptional regulator with XRE-family HTH domain
MAVDSQSTDADANHCQHLHEVTGWTADTLADKLRLSERAVDQWLNDNYSPSQATRERAIYLSHKYHAQQTPAPDLLESLKTEMRCTNQELADKLDVTHGAISNWIREYADPSTENKHRIDALYADYHTRTTLLDVIRGLRDGTDLTQSDIAAELGVARNSVGYWLREEQKPAAHAHRTALRTLYHEHTDTNPN